MYVMFKNQDAFDQNAFKIIKTLFKNKNEIHQLLKPTSGK